MSLLDDVSIVVTPNGYKAGTLYGVIPVPTEGSELILSTLVNSTGFSYDTFDNATSSGFHAINTSGTDQRAGTVDELVIVANKRYKINIDINVASGSTPFFRLRESIGSGTTIKSGSLVEGNNTIYVTSSISQTSVIEFQSNSISEYTASNVSVKEYTASDMDVTRATAATRVNESGLIEDVLANVPRIDYTGGGCPHILAEPQRTNLVTYSEDLSQWTLVNGTLTPNATVSPDGTQNAGKVVFNNTGVDLKRTITVVAGQTYTISFYIKLESGAGLNGRFYDNSNGANIEYYDFTSQVQGTQWSRVTRSVTAPSGCTEMQIWLLASSSSLVTASFWGAQFEQASYPTSYIPTSGSTVTRNQDEFTRDGIASLINSTEGVLFAEISALADDSTQRAIGLSNGTGDERIAIVYNDASNVIRLFCKSGGVTTSIIYSSGTIVDYNKIAVKWNNGNDYALWVNGTEVGTSVTGSSFPTDTLSELSFSFFGTNTPFYGKVKQLQVYDTALTDNQLIQLTGEAGTHFFESYSEMAETLTYTIQ